MNFKDLAKKLIEAGTKPERETLLDKVPKSDFVRLAFAVKETIYQSWTREPTKIDKGYLVLRDLLKHSSNTEIAGLAHWIKGISFITKGKNDKAIDSLNEAAKRFILLENDFLAAQIQNSKIYALALLGHYDEAIETGKKAQKVFESYNDDFAIGKIKHNIGNIFYRRNSYKKAQTYYISARKHYLKLKDQNHLAMVENSLAVVLALQNNFQESKKLYAQALRHAQNAKMFVTEAEIEASMGNLALFRGKYDEALKFLENSRQKYESLGMPHQTAIAKLEIADVYLELNLTTEAVSIYERLVDKLHELKLQGEEARARANFGRVSAALNQPQRARKELKKAAQLYGLEKNKVGAAAIKLSEANLELNLRNYKKALKLSEEAENLFRQSEDTRHLLTVRWLKAEALRNLGETERAREMLSCIFTESINQEQPNIAQSAQISLGKLAIKQKNYRRAERHFKRAIALIETLRAPLAAEEFRMAFLANKLAPFENLAKIYLAENKFTKAFLTLEKARARSLAESLSDAIQPVNKEENNDSKKLTRKLEVLREELNWFYSRLNRAGDAEIEKLQTEAKKREKQIADVMRQIASISKSRFGKQDFLDFARLQNGLGKQKALLEFVNFDGNLSAFIITDKTIRFIANLGKESDILALLEDLQFQFESLRYGAKVLRSFMPELKKRADFYLQKLYEKLVEPLESSIEKRDLVIVPVGALHYVPFHALFDGAHYQIEKREIVYAPSATVWQFLASKPKRKLKNALLIGFADERIPLVTREIENLKKIFAASKTFTGEEATFSAYAENAAKFDILHLACHGQFRPENPMFSSLHLADGWITVRDVCSQRLKAEVVTLSACETGLHKIFAGDEILGLARGFLAAGAKSLILSLWTVNDEATTELMSDFYKNLQPGKTVSASLRAAQINFIKCDAHPYFWSPFILIGR